MKILLIVVPALFFYFFIDFMGVISSNDDISLKINGSENEILQKLDIDLSHGGKNFSFEGSANMIYKLSIKTSANEPEVRITNNENFKNAAILKIIRSELCSFEGKTKLYTLFFHLKQNDSVELLIEPPNENSAISTGSEKDGLNHFEISVFETDEAELNKLSEKEKTTGCVQTIS